jgi:hypothetical protein
MSRYQARVIIFSYETGGRPMMPVGSGYSPHACTPGGQEYLPIVLHHVPPSATCNVEFEAVIELRYPDRLDYMVLTTGQEFDLVEGAKRVGRARLIASSC